MDKERGPVDSRRLNSLTEKMRDKRYRDGYVASHTRRLLAQQMRNLRGDLSQSEFAEALGKRQTVISRLENPGYGAWQLRTMLEIAQKLDIAVFARFVDFPTFLKLSDDLSNEAVHPASYNQDAMDEAVRREVAPAGGGSSAWNDFFPAGKQPASPVNDDIPHDPLITEQNRNQIDLRQRAPERQIA